LEFSQEVVLADDEFHGCADLEKGTGRCACDPLWRGKIEKEELYRKRVSVEKCGMPLSLSC
jgi:hypothetical protein